MGSMRIISHKAEPFADRVEAGTLLARQLLRLRSRSAVVLGIPRGGVVVADALARELDAEMDIVLARKIGAPGNPELAIGAVTESGQVFVDKASASVVAATAAHLERETSRAIAENRRRAGAYREVRPKLALAGRIVVVTDDGVATGATMKAALWAARQEEPVELICAVPVGAADSLAALSEQADEVVCLRVPPFFDAVGRFYVRFEQTQEDELLEILRTNAERQAVR